MQDSLETSPEDVTSRPFPTYDQLSYNDFLVGFPSLIILLITQRNISARPSHSEHPLPPLIHLYCRLASSPTMAFAPLLVVLEPPLPFPLKAQSRLAETVRPPLRPRGRYRYPLVFRVRPFRAVPGRSLRSVGARRREESLCERLASVQ